MKIIKFLIAILILGIIVFCIFKIRTKMTGFFKATESAENINSIIKNIDMKGVETGFIQQNFSGAIDEVKGYAENYYQDVMKDYVDKAKEGISGAVEDFKGYYNQGVDDLGDAITNQVNAKIIDGLDKIKVK